MRSAIWTHVPWRFFLGVLMVLILTVANTSNELTQSFSDDARHDFFESGTIGCQARVDVHFDQPHLRRETSREVCNYCTWEGWSETCVGCGNGACWKLDSFVYTVIFRCEWNVVILPSYPRRSWSQGRTDRSSRFCVGDDAWRHWNSASWSVSSYSVVQEIEIKFIPCLP